MRSISTSAIFDFFLGLLLEHHVPVLISMVIGFQHGQYDLDLALAAAVAVVAFAAAAAAAVVVVVAVVVVAVVAVVVVAVVVVVVVASAVPLEAVQLVGVRTKLREYTFLWGTLSTALAPAAVLSPLRTFLEVLLALSTSEDDFSLALNFETQCRLQLRPSLADPLHLLRKVPALFQISPPLRQSKVPRVVAVQF